MTSSNTVVPARASVPASRRTTPGRKPVTARRISANTVPYLLLAPAVVAILGLLGWPVVSVVIDSFQDLGPRQINLHLTEWVGFANYRHAKHGAAHSRLDQCRYQSQRREDLLLQRRFVENRRPREHRSR